MKRFWSEARAIPRATGFGVELDGKPVRLPGGAALRLDSAPLAAAIAEEWGGVGEEFALEDLRLTRLAGTGQERIAPDPEPVVVALARYAETDLLCYRAETPPELVERQELRWQPWLDWAERRFGARLAVTAGVRHVPQHSAALAALAAAVAAHDPLTIAGLGVLVPALGSLVLGLAVVEGALSAEEAFALSVLDETFQAEHWGEDEQAAARRLDVARDVAMAARFVRLVAAEPAA